MADTFTPEQITQILEEFFKVVGTRRYIGERYVPIFGRKGEESIEWDNAAPYEPLTIVLYQGNSYTSRQYVPIGVDITNQEFWVITGNYNAQTENAITAANNAQNDIDTLLPKMDFSAENTVKKYIDENPTRILTFDTVADMQAATNLLAGMTCHTNGFHTIGDGGATYYTVSASGTANGMDVLALQDGLYAHKVREAGATKISLADLPNAPDGVYTLGIVDVDSPIKLPRVNNRKIIIVDTVFNINTPILFPAYSSSIYFILPSFVSCVFNNMTSERVLISSGSNNTVGSRFTGCNFINVDAVSGNGYIQDFNFTGCYIQSYATFLSAPNTTVQARFVNCTVESESHQLIDGKNVVAYFSGTYEGNAAKDFYFVKATRCNIEFNSCWFESCKMLSLEGMSTITGRSVINVSSCNVNGYTDSTPVITITNPDYVSLYINGSRFTAYNTNSRFTDVTPDSFERLVGSFTLTHGDNYALPIGGINAQDKGYATIDQLTALDNSRFIAQKLILNTTVIASGGIDINDIPVGEYLMVVGRGSYSVFNTAIVNLIGASNENSTYTNVISLISRSDSYLNALTFTATKANESDKTFTLNVNSSMAVTAYLTLIKLF